MNRSNLVKQINKKLTGLAKGLFTDEYWKGMKIVADAIEELNEELNLDFTLYHNTYIHSNEGTPVGKRWYYESHITNIIKKPIIIIIIASGAGTVADPLSKYDIISYAS